MTGLLETPPKRHRIAGFDGLRAIAVLFVFLYHRAGINMGMGPIGVQLFFVLSGFLIIGGVMAETGHDVGPALRRFFINRAFRILPVYAVFLVAVATVLVLAPPPDLLWAEVAHAATFTSNWYLMHPQGPVVLVHTWSLSIEEQFYLFAAPAMLLVRRRWAIRLCYVLIAAAVGRACYLIEQQTPWFMQYPDSIINFGIMAFGGLLSQATQHRLSWLRDWHVGTLLTLMLLSPIIVFLLPSDPFNDRGLVKVWGTALIAGALLVAVAKRQTSPAVRLLELWPLVQLGRISYAFYLFHYAISAEIVATASLDALDVRAASQPVQALVLFPIVLGLSIASWFVIERPMMRVRSRLLNRLDSRAVTVAAPAMLSMEQAAQLPVEMIAAARHLPLIR